MPFFLFLIDPNDANTDIGIDYKRKLKMLKEDVEADTVK